MPLEDELGPPVELDEASLPVAPDDAVELEVVGPEGDAAPPAPPLPPPALPDWPHPRAVTTSTPITTQHGKLNRINSSRRRVLSPRVTPARCDRRTRAARLSSLPRSGAIPVFAGARGRWRKRSIRRSCPKSGWLLPPDARRSSHCPHPQRPDAPRSPRSQRQRARTSGWVARLTLLGSSDGGSGGNRRDPSHRSARSRCRRSRGLPRCLPSPGHRSSVGNEPAPPSKRCSGKLASVAQGDDHAS